MTLSLGMKMNLQLKCISEEKKHPIRLFVSVVDKAKKTIADEPKRNDVREGTAITVAD